MMSKISTQVIQLFFMLLLARYISPADFGTIGVLSIFITISNVLIDSGMSASLIKEKDITTDDCSSLFTFNISVSVLLYCIIYICSPLIEHYFHIETLARVCKLIAIPIIINAISIVPKTLLVKRLKFNIIFWVQFISMLLSCVITAVFVVVYEWKLDALILYYNLSAIFPSVGYVLWMKYIPRFKIKKQSIQKLFGFGFFNTMSNIVDTIYENILSIFIGKYLNVAQVGYYSQAKRLEEVPSKSITDLICGTSFPLLCTNNEDKDWYIRKIIQIQHVLYSIMIPIMMLIMIYAKDIIRLVLGENWAQASPYLILLAFAGIWVIIENTNRTFIKSLGRADIMFWASIFKRALGIIIIILALLLSPAYLLYAYIIASMIAALINAYALSTLIPYPLMQQLKLWLQSLVPACIFYIISIILYNSINSYCALIPLTGIAIILYIAMLPLFGITDIRELLKELLLMVTSAIKC